MTIEARHPEVRKQLSNMLESSITALLLSLRTEVFTDPNCDANLEILTEATAAALATLAKDSQNKDAILRTFALNILDQTKIEG